MDCSLLKAEEWCPTGKEHEEIDMEEKMFLDILLHVNDGWFEKGLLFRKLTYFQ